MKFCSFPYLVQKEILQHMSPLELLIASQLSKKHKKHIQFMLKNELPKIGNISYCSNGVDNCRIFQNQTVEIVAIKPVFDSTFWRTIRSKMFGKELECRIRSKKPLFIFCEKEHGPSLLKSIHKEIYSLFGRRVTYELRETETGKHIPKLPHITKANLFLDTSQNPQELISFFDICPKQMDWLSIHPKILQLDRPLNFPEVQELQITAPTNNKDFLENFNGKILNLLWTRFNTDDIIQFLKYWKAGNRYQNLEYFDIDHGKHMCDPVRIMDEMNIRKFHEDFEPPAHPSWTRETWHHGGIIDFRPTNFCSNTYIERESDGHVAYVHVTSQTVTFAVWNMTLEQLREYEPLPSNNHRYCIFLKGRILN